MMSRSFYKKDQLQIQNVQAYFQPIQNLTFFVENVAFPDSLFADRKYRQCKDGFFAGYKKYDKKVILPWKHLIQRMNNQNIGVTQIHIGFLRVIQQSKLFKFGLSVADSPILPKSIQPQRYKLFLNYCAQIYINLHKFKQAYSCIQRALQIQGNDINITLDVFKKNIFLSKVLGKLFSKHQLHTFIQKIKITIGSQSRQVLFKAQSLLDAFLQLLDDKKQLSQKSMITLQSQRHYWIAKIEVKPQLGQNTYRIKASQVKNESILSFQNIRDINRFQKIYKYDNKNGVIYFENKAVDQQKLNKMISQSCNMYNQLTNYQKEPKLGKQKSGGMSRMMGMMF